MKLFSEDEASEEEEIPEEPKRSAAKQKKGDEPKQKVIVSVLFTILLDERYIYSSLAGHDIEGTHGCCYGC